MYIHIYMVCININMHIYGYINIYIHIYVWICIIYTYIYIYIYVVIYIYIYLWLCGGSWLSSNTAARPLTPIWVVGRGAALHRGVAGHSPAIIRFWQFWSNLMIGNRSFIFQNRILENREFQFQSDGPCPVSSTYKDLYVNVHTDHHHWPVRNDDPWTRP